MIKRKLAPSHPGAILRRRYMEPINLTITELAGNLRVSRKTISKITNERGSLTADMALRLSRAFGTTPELWLNLQRNFDLWNAIRISKEWKVVEKIAA